MDLYGLMRQLKSEQAKDYEYGEKQKGTPEEMPFLTLDQYANCRMRVGIVSLR